jgi:TM2 domain-containing membrane protein YozV
MPTFTATPLPAPARGGAVAASEATDRLTHGVYGDSHQAAGTRPAIDWSCSRTVGSMYGAAGYGSDPTPYSDKSKVTAGLLQLLPGFLVALGGLGRLYAGNTRLGVIQLVATVIGWVSFWCGYLLIVPWVITGAVWLWFVIDGIAMLAGRPVDGQGRPLRS